MTVRLEIKFLFQLLRKNPNARLGSKSKKTDAIRRHKFFRSVDWVALERREISPPIVPIVVSIGIILLKEFFLFTNRIFYKKRLTLNQQR